MSAMTSVRANGVDLGVQTFGREDDSLVLLAGGPTMLSWPDAVCERLASGGRRVARYDLRDCGASTTLDPEAPVYTLRDLAADAAALVDTLGAAQAHLGGVGVGGMVAQVAALDHLSAFSALTLVSTWLRREGIRHGFAWPLTISDKDKSATAGRSAIGQIVRGSD
jgi:pimeloyl-ACP methyl ester carboxylesterase